MNVTHLNIKEAENETERLKRAMSGQQVKEKRRSFDDNNHNNRLKVRQTSAVRTATPTPKAKQSAP